MDHKFKVGDRVIFQEECGPAYAATVEVIDHGDDTVPYRVTFGGENSGPYGSGYAWATERDLSLVEEDTTELADPEVSAIDNIVEVLDNLTTDQTQRAIRYLCDRYGMIARHPGEMSPLYRSF